MNVPNMECPECQAKEDLKVLPKWKHANQLAILLGGIVLPTLWEYGRKTNVKCNNCGNQFGFRTRSAKISISVFWFFIAFIIVMMLLVGWASY